MIDIGSILVDDSRHDLLTAPLPPGVCHVAGGDHQCQLRGLTQASLGCVTSAVKW